MNFITVPLEGELLIAPLNTRVQMIESAEF